MIPTGISVGDISVLATVMALGYHFFCDPLSQPVVEHKVLPVEFIRKLFVFYFSRVIDDAALKMKNIAKTIMHLPAR